MPVSIMEANGMGLVANNTQVINVPLSTHVVWFKTVPSHWTESIECMAERSYNNMS